MIRSQRTIEWKRKREQMFPSPAKCLGSSATASVTGAQCVVSKARVTDMLRWKGDFRVRAGQLRVPGSRTELRGLVSSTEIT